MKAQETHLRADFYFGRFKQEKDDQKFQIFLKRSMIKRPMLKFKALPKHLAISACVKLFIPTNESEKSQV